ncbi:MAG: biotin/lipoyl-containing protein, partial [Miltoncostaeaceae bacterium]
MALFQMPKLSDTMEEGTILSWLVGEGEEVVKGQPLVEIETDKATMAVDSPADGALHRMAAEGDVLPVGADIAAIGEDAPVVEVPGDVDEEAPEQTNIPVGDDGTMSMIGSEVDLSETYPGAHDEEPEPTVEPPAPE